MNTPTIAIEERNAKFAASSKEDQRVMIAQEVLDLIASKKISPQRGLYIGSPFLDLLGAAEPDIELQDAFQRIDGAACHVCAVGASVIAVANLNDRLKLRDILDGGVDDPHAMRHRLTEHFTREEVSEMEDVFEGNGDYEDFSASLEAEECLTAIMKNIVENKGVVPPEEWKSPQSEEDYYNEFDAEDTAGAEPFT